MKNYKWGSRSLSRLNTCDTRLIDVLDLALERSELDLTILCGHRSKEEQDRAYKYNRSKLKFPESKHNSNPSRAVDVAPYPIDWEDIPRFHTMAKTILQAAEDLGIQIRWGGDWDMDGDTTDQTFNDLPHFEIL